MAFPYKVILSAKLYARAIVAIAVLGLGPKLALAGGGPLGIDHEWSYDNHGIWSAHYEQGLVYGVMIFEAGGARPGLAENRARNRVDNRPSVISI